MATDRNKRKRLNLDIAREIRASEEPAKVLAQQYGVSASAIYHIRTGRYYREEGTGEFVPRERRGRPRKPRQLCECGCGERVKGTKNRFIRNHARRDPEVRARMVAGLAAATKKRGENRALKGERTRMEDRGYATKCEIWLLGKTQKGYGLRKVTKGGKPTTTTEHRARYIEAHGSIPDNMHVDHLCGQPDCVNVEHLRLLSPAENARHGKQTMLSHSDIHEVKKALPSTLEALARRLRVTKAHLLNIRAGRRWKHVGE